MSFTKTLLALGRDTLADLIINVSTDGKYGQFYHVTDKDTYAIAKSDGTLTDPLMTGFTIDGDNNTTIDIGHEDTISFTGLGILQATIQAGEVSIGHSYTPGDAYRVPMVNASGTDVTWQKPLTVAAGSNNLLSISSDNEISVSQLLISTKTHDSTSTSLTNWIVLSGYDGTQDVDLLILDNVDDGNGGTRLELWMQVGNAGTEVDFVLVSIDPTDSYITSLLNGGEGIAYNNNTGEISLAYLRSNNNVLEFSNGGGWSSVMGDITSINISTGIGLQGSVIGTSGNVTGTISLSHLGLENLSDPNDNKIFYWNNTLKNSEFLSIGQGLSISGGILSNTITNNNQLINGAGFITGLSWNELGGNQQDINISGFTNDAGYTNFDGDYNSLSNLPVIPTNNNQLTNGAGYITDGNTNWNNVYGFITGVDWTDISGTQSDINLSGFTNDIGFSTFDGDYNSLTNIPTYTQGSIIFADSDGSLTEDNSQLYWDNVNNRLGIGTNNPTVSLQIGKITPNSENQKIIVTGYDNSQIEFNNHNNWAKPTISTNFGGDVSFVDYGFQNNTLRLSLGESLTRQGSLHIFNNNSESISIGLNGAYPIATLGIIEEGPNYTGGLRIKTRLSTNLTNDFYFSKYGNFGIGTTTPTEKLDVIGNIKADGILKLYDITDTQQISLNPDGDSYINGNIGIGTTTPSEKLDVDGNIKLNGSMTIFDGNQLNLNSTGNVYSGYIKKNGYQGEISLGQTIDIIANRSLRLFDNNGNSRWIFGTVIADTTINDIFSSFSNSNIYAGHNGYFGFYTYGSIVPTNVLGLFNRLDNNNNGVKLLYKSASIEYEGLVINNVGKVGIGTTTPTEKLDVIGNIKADGILKLYDITDTQQIELNPDGDSYINGNFGIGTSNPERNLHVADDVRIDSDLFVRTISTQYFSNTSNLNLIYGNAANFTIYSNTTERFRITSDGNVGIGTTSPDAKLTIEGSLSAASQGMENLLTLRRGFNSGVAFESSAALSLGRSLSDLHSRLDFILDDNNSAGHEYDSTVLTMLSNGNVGIGTTTPTEKLDVIGNIKTNGILKLYDVTDTQTISLNPNGDSYILNGNIGIGTSNPERNLHVADDVRIDSELYVRTISTQYFSNTSNLNLIYGDAANFNIYSNTTERFRITSDGNVGIGTTTPNDKLDIDGDIRVKRTNRKPTHEDVLTSDFVSVGSVSFYTDDWVKVKVIGRGDSGVNKSFAEYLIYYDGTAYNIELLNNIIVGDNSGFPLLRMNGSNLEIKNRDSINAGNYLIYFDDFISQKIFSGKTYNIEDFPLVWINGSYYNTYKDNTFVPNQNISIPNQSEYDAVTSIFLNIKSLTTDFTGTLLGKFSNLNRLDCYNNSITTLDVSNLTNLSVLRCESNSISVLDVSSLTGLTTLTCGYNSISVLDVSSLTNLTTFYCFNNSISVLDASNLVNLTDLRCRNNELDAATNSQILIDLDGHGLSNGYLNSSIFGTGFITPTGIDSFNNLLSKSWSVVGLTNQISAGSTYNVEDFPKIWIDNLYYNTYKDNTFVPSVNTLMTGQTEYNTVTSIFLNIKSLTTDFTGTLLGKFNNLSNLQCVSNQISVLDVSQNTNLTQLICYGNKIQTLDVSQLVNLNRLSCQINQIQTLDVSQLVNLNILQCKSNQISVLDVSQLVNLTYLECNTNQISVLDISNLVNLNILYCHNNQLDAAQNSQILIDLDTNGQSNGILNSSIFGGGFITPTGIDSFNNLLSKSWSVVGLTNQITAGATYNVEDFPKIWIDDLYYNTYKGDTFVPSVNTLMTGQTEYDTVTLIDLASQSLTTDFTSILLGKFVELENIFIANNFVSVLDVSNLTQVKKISCHGNSISVLDVANLLNLTYIHCGGNSISVLDVSNLTNLTVLYCYSNPISVLDVSNLLNLTAIHCGNVPISVLDVANLLNLTQLYCYGNSVSILDVVNLIELNTLHIHYTQIDFLDFTNLTKLNNFNGFGARLNSTVNSQLLVDLDGHGLSNGYLNSTIFGGGSLPHEGVSSGLNLLDKNWTVVGLPLNYLLNDYSGAAAAYSLYRLNTAYTGPAITVRRDSDNSVQDIGFVNGVLDTAALTTFCAGANGFVTIWYDQSNSNNNLTQSTASAQPKIFDSVNGIIELNGKPAIYTDGVDDRFQSSILSLSNPTTQFMVFKTLTSIGNIGGLYNSANFAPALFGNLPNRVLMYQQGPGFSPVFTHNQNQSLVTMKSSTTGTDWKFFGNSSEILNSGENIGSIQGNQISLGARNNNTLFTENYLQEYILYNSDETGNRVAIEENINSRYNIYS